MRGNSHLVQKGIRSLQMCNLVSGASVYLETKITRLAAIGGGGLSSSEGNQGLGERKLLLH